MNIDLSRFKVVYSNKVLIALSLISWETTDDTDWEDIHKELKFIEIMVINEAGNIEVIRDEAWRFQFIPIINGKG